MDFEFNLKTPVHESIVKIDGRKIDGITEIGVVAKVGEPYANITIHHQGGPPKHVDGGDVETIIKGKLFIEDEPRGKR